MRLDQLIEQYIGYRQSLGEKFKTNSRYLKSFCKFMGSSVEIGTITEAQINAYLYKGSDKITSGWFIKHTAMLGFYRYALTRDYVTNIPLPKILPKHPQPFVPYIYSDAELKLLFSTALTYRTNKSHVDPYMVRATLILTYVLGLRLHETLAIKLGNVDIDSLVITIQQSKFYKSRLVPFNDQVGSFLQQYLTWRKSRNHPENCDSYLFLDDKGKQFNIGTMREAFKLIRKKAGISRQNQAYQPRIHDLRHTFAVNRLTTWYQENKDVQQLLPILSTYLGHTYLAHTSVYLSMTKDLLKSANNRFENYVFIGE